MLRTSLCDYSDAYILAGGTITGNDHAVRQLDERNNGVIFKNCASFADCIIEINNTQIDHAKYIDIRLQCIILLNIVIIVRKHQEVCRNVTEMIQMILYQNLNHSNTRLR